MKLRIINEKGLHARASAKLAETCEAFDADATILYDGLSANGRSIMGLMMLGAANGAEIELQTEGQQADELAHAVAALIGDYFGEGR